MEVLVQIDAYDPEREAAVTLRASSADDPRVCHLDGKTWWPSLGRLPTLRQDWFDGDFSGNITVPTSDLDISVEPWPDFNRYAFTDARIRIYTGERGTLWDHYTLRFDGRISSQPKTQSGLATLTFSADDKWLDTPLLKTYAGTGGAEGDETQAGIAKPFAMGAPRFVSGVMIDTVNVVVQLSDGPIEGAEMAFDRVVRFGDPIGDYASYAALVAATIPPGQWATANAVGMVRHGAPFAGRPCWHIKGDNGGPDGWARLPGQIIRRMALLSGGEGRIDDDSLDALDLACPWDLSIDLDSQTTARDVIQRIAASVNAVAGLSWLSKLYASPVEIVTPTLKVSADGDALPPVASNEQIEIAAPWWKLAIQAQRTWSVFALSEVAPPEPPLPVEKFTRAPSKPAAPTGNNTPTGWYDQPPGYVFEPFGPVWRSTAIQQEGITNADGWSEPVLSDSLYQGWSLALNGPGSGTAFMQAATNAIKATSDFDPWLYAVNESGDDRWTFDPGYLFFIPLPIQGPWRLKCTVTSATARVAFGAATSDPTGVWTNYAAINTGIYIDQNDQEFRAEIDLDTGDQIPTTCVTLFTDFDPYGGLDHYGAEQPVNAYSTTPTGPCDYELIYNGDSVEVYVAGAKVRTFFPFAFHADIPGFQETYWPFFQLLGADAEITNIEWGRSTQGVTFPFPVTVVTGGIIRTGDGRGFTTAPAPSLPFTGAASITSLEFAGGGRVEANVYAPTTGWNYMACHPQGTIYFYDDHSFKTEIDGTYTLGTYADGDLFSIVYSVDRLQMFKNGLLIRTQYVSAFAFVYGYFNFGPSGTFRNLVVQPSLESEFTPSGWVNDDTLTSPITDGSSTVTGGYIVVATTGDLAVTPTSGDKVVVSASFTYVNSGTSSVSFTPDTKIQYSTDSGSTWTDLTTTQVPSSTVSVAPGDGQSLLLNVQISVSVSTTYEFRLVVKNLVAGTYSASTGGYLSAVWHG